MSINVFLSIFLSGLVFIFILRKFFLLIKPKGFFVEKDKRGVVKVGGIILCFSFLFAGLFFYHDAFFKDSLNLKIILTTFLVFILGLIDDGKELKIWQKFLGELIITFFFILISGMTTEIIFFPKSINFIITLVWILGITNAFNLLDIQDGLAAGVGFLISLAFLYLAHFTGNIFVEQISLILAGALSAILIFNLPPAKIYLGDSGSLCLGYVLSILAISLSYAQAAHEMALLSPIFILGFPIFDTIFVSLRRLSQGRSIFKKSDDHFIFCLIKQGRKKSALFICYLLSLLFISLGILFMKLSNLFSLVLIILFLKLLYHISFKVSRVQ
ncbi:MAG: undecaprenyl/decaprenyl-phosphate alpha-N-acetylglucosaminyl 1-phosphate transferase [Candidatus Omnitrophica bacterium]|nr:undecaprenyl/decaprenyl-phosphate alpha-N-acetylglucosaminyl 1-phosphate transferase [Candidatus Omnitrophota bacterium]